MKLGARLSHKASIHVIRTIPIGVALLCLLMLGIWLGGEGEGHWEMRLPGSDNAGSGAPEEAVSSLFQGRLVQSEGIAADLPGSWPRFRGARFDGISTETVPLARAWAGGELRRFWEIDVGEGYAGAAILNGRVYVMDYDVEGSGGGGRSLSVGEDALRCLSLADGKEIWRYAYPVKVKRNHGMSRTVPAVTQDYVVAMGPKCHVICLNAETGTLLWKLDLAKEYGTRVPPWYAGQCPLIDDGLAIIAPAGDEVLLMAVDCETGEVRWKTPNPRAWQMTHASIVPMMLEGRRTYVYCGSGGVVGVAADTGEILWENMDWKISIATIASPLIVDGGRVFLAGGYNAGSMMLQVVVQKDAWSAEPVFRLEPEVFGATQHTPIFYEGHIYGVRPNGDLVCMTPDGTLLWNSGTAHRFGLGPFMIAGGLIFVMNDSGLLCLVEANPNGYRQLAQSQVLDGHDSWGPMALAGGRLIVRDMTRMVCLDVMEP
ncbi:MAG: PQQ-like beta-propeller repeat protein [Candidatus Latescibacteria bacterium]|nr:PQQ-like beta-propeller repeat protein [Candidatus Latescibacterota bacterium]